MKDAFSELSEHTLSRVLLEICLWGAPVAIPSLVKPPLEYKSFLEEPEMGTEPEPHLTNRLSGMKEQLRHLYSQDGHHVSGSRPLR